MGSQSGRAPLAGAGRGEDATPAVRGEHEGQRPTHIPEAGHLEASTRKPKNLWTALPKNPEEARKRAFPDSKKKRGKLASSAREENRRKRAQLAT